jgi:hypothetical protein
MPIQDWFREVLQSSEGVTFDASRPSGLADLGIDVAEIPPSSACGTALQRCDDRVLFAVIYTVNNTQSPRRVEMAKAQVQA